jgi:hypothetical protein
VTPASVSPGRRPQSDIADCLPSGRHAGSSAPCTTTWRSARLIVASCAVWFGTCALSVAAPPTLTHLFPAGGQRGSKVVVTAAGTFTWPVKVGSAGIDAVAMADSGKIEVTIPGDLAADRVWIRLYNAEGTSTPVPFLIGSMKEADEQEPNDRPREAQAVTERNVTINGGLKDSDVDCFAVSLAAGQTFVAALDANTRLGSPMDAILQVVSLNGTVLAENHDDLKLDPRLAFTAPAAGTYVVRLFAFPAAPDTGIRFIGGASYVYRLTLTTGPFATHAVPLSVSLTNPGVVKAAGWNLLPETSLMVVPFGGPSLADQQEFESFDDLRRLSEARIGFAYSADFATTARVRMTPLNAVLATTPADPQNPMVVPAGTSVTACLTSRGQGDVYRIPLQKGQQAIISVEARSLDLLLDPVIRLADPAGSIVAEIDDTGTSRDALITHTAAHDGEYRLTINDRFRKGGERCWYLLTVSFEQPDFILTASAEAIVVAPDKPADFAVKLQRRGPAAEAVGPISVELTGLPAGVTSAAVISETTGPTATDIKLTITTTGPAFSGPVKIIGKTTQPKEMQRFARTPPRLGVTFETFWLTVMEKP